MYKDFISENLDSDPLYSEIEHKILQFDDSKDPLLDYSNSIENNRFNWNEVINSAENLLSKGMDIRVVLWKMRASLHIEGICSFYENIKILENLIIKPSENFTDDDRYIASNFAASLGWLSTPQCINEIKNSFICPSVRISLKTMSEIDILKSNNTLTYPELITSIEKANIFFKDEKKIPELKEQLNENINILKLLEDFVNEYTDGYLLDCKNLVQLLMKLLSKLKSFDELSLESDDNISEEVVARSNNFNNNSKAKSLNEIRYANTRSEAVLLLDNVLQYFQIHEPSHPAPILIKRAQKMIGMDFESIIKELLPESIEALKLYTGKIQEENNINN